MPSGVNWRIDSRMTVGDVADRAVSAWLRIQDRPTSISIMRGSDDLEAQTVRIEYSTQAGEASGRAGVSAVRDVTIFGVADHPDASVEDTDIQKADRIVLSGSEYRVVDVVAYPGEVQAFAERVT